MTPSPMPAPNTESWTPGDRLRQHRNAVGLSQVALGAVVNRSADTVRNWEQGLPPRLEAWQWNEMARALKVGTIALLHWWIDYPGRTGGDS